MKLILISKILIGDRIREDLGDIDQLADSIKEYGMLNPITIRAERNNKFTLLSGFRRLEAVKKLSWKNIECNILKNSEMFMFAKHDLFEHTCQVCDHPITEKHHILPRHMGGNDTKKNLIDLCPTHHSVFDFLTKMQNFNDNPDLEKQQMGKESKKSWKIMEFKAKIHVYDFKAIQYFETFIVPQLPKIFSPTDNEIYKAMNIVKQKLTVDAIDEDSISNEEMYKMTMTQIKKTRAKHD